MFDALDLRGIRTGNVQISLFSITLDAAERKALSSASGWEERPMAVVTRRAVRDYLLEQGTFEMSGPSDRRFGYGPRRRQSRNGRR
jgi:hypothetical protein